MNVLLLTTDFPPAVGGIQVYTAEIATRLHRLGRVRVIAPRVPGWQEHDRSSDVEIVRVGGGSNGFVLSAASAVRRSVGRDGYRTVLCAQWPAALAALLGRPRGSGARIHLAAHGRELLFNPLPSVAGRLYAGVRRNVFERVDRIYPVSRFTAGLVQSLGVPEDRLRIVEPGADPKTFFPRDGYAARRELGIGSNPMILTVCRLVRRKGVDLLLEAMPDILADHPQAALVVAGDGPEGRELRSQARSLGIADSVRFPGRVDAGRLPELFSAADVFIMTPRTDPLDVEGFGLVYLEAGACATPVIGSRTGGVPDAIQDGVTGLLVPPDDPSAISAAVQFFLSNSDVSKQFGEAGRNHVVERANWDTVVGKLAASMATS